MTASADRRRILRGAIDAAIRLISSNRPRPDTTGEQPS